MEKTPLILTIISSLISSAVVGTIIMYGSTRSMAANLDNVISEMRDLKADLKDFNREVRNISVNAANCLQRNADQDRRIEFLEKMTKK